MLVRGSRRGKIMGNDEDALIERVTALLGHLEEAPATAAVLPFTVAYLVDRLRDSMLVRTNIAGTPENIFSGTP
jgi:hypothetical protein